MAHNHGNEYQIRIVREDGIEELSGWMNSTEEVAQAMLAVHRPKGKTYWLLARTTLCLNCSDGEQIMEYPIYYKYHKTLVVQNHAEQATVDR